MFKVTIKQYVIPLCALVLIAAVLNSGCLESSTGNTAVVNGVPDLPIQPAADEKVLKTTPDGLNFFEKESDVYVTNTYRGAYDIDNDGDIDIKESVIDQDDAARDGNIANSIRAIYGIPIDSKMYDEFPEGIQELRERKHDLDGDGKFKEQVDLLINGKIVCSTTTDTDQDGGISLNDILIERGWK